MAITSVPIRTNGELRPSRLFNSMFGYIKKSMLTIVRAFMMYRPLYFFSVLGSVLAAIGVAIASVSCISSLAVPEPVIFSR